MSIGSFIKRTYDDFIFNSHEFLDLSHSSLSSKYIKYNRLNQMKEGTPITIDLVQQVLIDFKTSKLIDNIIDSYPSGDRFILNHIDYILNAIENKSYSNILYKNKWLSFTLVRSDIEYSKLWKDFYEYFKESLFKFRPKYNEILSVNDDSCGYEYIINIDFISPIYTGMALEETIPVYTATDMLEIKAFRTISDNIKKTKYSETSYITEVLDDITFAGVSGSASTAYVDIITNYVDRIISYINSNVIDIINGDSYTFMEMLAFDMYIFNEIITRANVDCLSSILKAYYMSIVKLIDMLELFKYSSSEITLPYHMYKNQLIQTRDKLLTVQSSIY